jgi:hypothetical protein
LIVAGTAACSREQRQCARKERPPTLRPGRAQVVHTVRLHQPW